MGELDLARVIGFADRPIAAADFGGTILHHEKNNARRED